MSAIKVCVGFGMYNACDDCRHNMENHPDFNGTANHPDGMYEPINSEICQLVKPYWSQYEPINRKGIERCANMLHAPDQMLRLHNMPRKYKGE